MRLSRLLALQPLLWLLVLGIGLRSCGGAAPVPTAVPTPTPAAVVAPTVTVSPTPTVAPTAAPTLTPTATPVPTATPLPTPTATATPTPLPRAMRVPGEPIRQSDTPPPAVAARSVVVLDEESNTVLYERAGHERLPPASLTKIATALVALDLAPLTQRVRAVFDPASLGDSSLMGLRPGDELSLEDLLYGLMLPSGNDAALAIATGLAGSEERFVALMNARVQALGLKNTHFQNPHGLDAPGHYSSAYDLVQLARVGMRDPRFRRIVGTRVWALRTPRAYEITNRNRLLWEYPGADGVKTGYTERAGRTLVASAVRDGHRVYVALLNSPDPFAEARRLFDWVFATFTWPAGAAGR